MLPSLMCSCCRSCVALFFSLFAPLLYFFPWIVYTNLQKTSRDFTTKTNEIVTEINNSYSNLDQGDIGRVIPDGAINESYLSEKLKTDFNYISMTTGMYIDRTVESDITIPEEIKGKALVLKAIGN